MEAKGQCAIGDLPSCVGQDLVVSENRTLYEGSIKRIPHGYQESGGKQGEMEGSLESLGGDNAPSDNLPHLLEKEHITAAKDRDCGEGQWQESGSVKSDSLCRKSGFFYQTVRADQQRRAAWTTLGFKISV
jgi:hypothetical protein